MVQGREDFRLALEAGQSIVVSCERRRQDLDGDLAIEFRVRRAVDLAHAAGANGRDHFIGAETGARSEGQRWRQYMTTGPGTRCFRLTLHGRWMST